jgi:HEAT repeat protein
VRLPYRITTAALMGLALVTPARAGRLDDLVAKLGGSNEAARSLARQLLPREGAAAVPKILPLLGRDDPNVWNAAFQTLADLANEVSMPGREAERADVAACLMTLVGPDQPEELKHRGLRLLPIVLPDKFDVSPIARLLDEPRLREKARVALEEAGTSSACVALREHLGKSDPAFTVALLNALGRLEDPGSLDAIRGLAKAGAATVRVAAARALAWTGEPGDLGLERVTLVSADAANKPEAVDAVLRQLITIARKPERRGLAVEAYKELVKSGEGVEKDAALAGLGRIGDASSVATVLDAIKQAEPPTLLVGIAALRTMPGDDVTQALVAAYPDLSPGLKARLISALGARKHAAVVPLLAAASESADVPTRQAAIEALGQTGLPESLAQLVKLISARGPDGKERAVPAGVLLSLADALLEKGDHGNAGQAFLKALLGTRPGDTKPRQRALEGIASCPLPEAADAVRSAAREKELREPVTRALLAVAGALVSKGDNTRAIELYEIVRGMNPSTEVVQALVKGMAAAGSSADLRGLLGTVSRWYVIGPFELGPKHEGWNIAYVGEPDVSMVARFMAGKRRVQWTPVVSTEANGHIDLRKTVGNRDLCVGYAYAEIIVDKPTDAVLLLGVDDSERIWVNGQKVFEQFVARGFTPDEDKVPVRLNAGTNKILLKIYQNGMGWEFCVRIVAPDGRPVSFMQKAE